MKAFINSITTLLLASLMTVLIQAVDSQSYFRSAPPRELETDKMDVLIKVVKAMNSDECKQAITTCYTEDCLGCGNSSSRRDLVMNDEDPMAPVMMFYGFNYTCEDLFDGSRTAMECMGDGDLDLYCDAISSCYGMDDM